jgi:hypothetical protein
VIGVTREPACLLTFPMTRESGQSEDITVQRYFLEKYKRQLMYVKRGIFLKGGCGSRGGGWV